MKEKKVGKIEHYYNHLGVAIVKLGNSISAGDKLHFLGHTTDFEQKAESIELEKKKIEKAKKGDSIGIKIDNKVRKHDMVYKVEE